MKSSSKLFRKSLWTSSIVTMLLIISVMVPMVAEVAEAEINTTGTYFWVDPKDNKVEPYCTVFPVNIMIESADETWAWEATLNFNQTVLGVMSVTEGPWLSESGAKDTTFFTTSWVEANETGTISIGCTLLGDVPGASGSGLLCTINFHVEYCGRSPLDLQDTALLDMDLVRTEYPNNDGFFCATCALECLHDVAIVDVRVNVGAEVDQGAVIEVNVTIHNEGSHIQTVIVRAYAEKVTHDPLDPDKVLVGDEILIGEEPVADIEPCNYISVYFIWDTTPVPGEVYTMCAEVIKPEDNDPHDNVFIGPVVRVVCPHDIKVTDVKLLTPKLHVGQSALVNVTVLNEGANTESFNVEVYADLTKVAEVGVVDLAAGASKTVSAGWIPTTPGEYPISAVVPAVTGEKDTLDNSKADGILIVIYDDVAIIDATLYPPCGYKIEITIKNNGTDMARFMVYVWADPTPEDPFGGDELMIGLIVGGSLASGANLTFVGLSPYGGIPYGIYWPALYPPGAYLTPCATYGIFIQLEKMYDTDDNPANNAFYAGTILPRYAGDINADGKVNPGDLGPLSAAWLSSSGDPNWNMQCDFNWDGKVNPGDLGPLSANWLESC